MRAVFCLILAAFAILQWIMVGFNLYTMGFLIFVCFIAGMIGGSGRSNADRDSDNLATLAQIERNRYFRKEDK